VERAIDSVLANLQQANQWAADQNRMAANQANRIGAVGGGGGGVAPSVHWENLR
jgi:hypothetical protein